MAVPKILVIPGSLRTGSHNGRLAAIATKELALLDAEVTRISLEDYALPLFDADRAAGSGPPAAAVKLKQALMAHRGVFITSPEYSASITPLLKNAIDWVSRVRERGEPTYAAFKGRVFALGSATSGSDGGVRSLIALRQISNSVAGRWSSRSKSACRAPSSPSMKTIISKMKYWPRRCGRLCAGWSNWPV